MSLSEKNFEKRNVLHHNKTVMSMIGAKRAEGFSKKKTSKKEKLRHILSFVKEPPFLARIDANSNPTQSAEPELALWLANGQEVRSLDQLTNALRTISARNFAEHLERHDIADWIKDVLERPEVAKDFEKSETREKAVKILERHIGKIKKRISELSSYDFKDSDDKRSLGSISLIEESLKKKEMELEQKEAELREKIRELHEEKQALAKARMNLETEKEDVFFSGHDLNSSHLNKTSDQKSSKSQQDESFEVHEGQHPPFMFKEKVDSLLDKAKDHFEKDEVISAERTKVRIKDLLNLSTLDAQDKKQIKDKILEMELNMKLRALERDKAM